MRLKTPASTRPLQGKDKPPVQLVVLIYRIVGESNQRACQAVCAIGRADGPARAPSGAKQRDPPTPILRFFSRERVLNFFEGVATKSIFSGLGLK